MRDTRQVITNYIVTQRKVKLARAELILRYINEMKAHEMWARIELETEDLNKELDKATIEYIIITKDLPEDEREEQSTENSFNFGFNKGAFKTGNNS
jgi:uncharacterized protein (DUF849 family)